jgi:hypothetical protein
MATNRRRTRRPPCLPINPSLYPHRGLDPGGLGYLEGLPLPHMSAQPSFNLRTVKIPRARPSTGRCHSKIWSTITRI